MEEVQELKHACKFCNKSFPCGRSLGGHMRCHLINNSTEKSRNHDQKLNSSNRISTTHTTTTATKLSSSSSSFFELASAGGYGLRENPKKTWRFSDNNNNNVVSSDQETSIFCCRECGKGFQSWKALFGHMKSHSDKLDKPSASSINKNNNSLLEEEEEEDSSLNQSANQTKMVLDSQSDNETNTAPNNCKKKKTKRSHRRTRYNVNNSSSSCFNASAAAAAAAAAADVSENVEQEQEEVAMCLMMLSRDHGGLKLSVAAESSDNFSGSSKSPPCSTKTSGIVTTKTCSEILRSRRIVSGERSESFFASGNGKSWSRMSRTEVSSDGFLRKDKKKKAFVKQEKVVEKESEKLMDTNCKRKKLLHDDDGDGDGDEGCYDPELRSDSLKISDPENNMCNKSSHKRSKFECTTCNKTFHSYQALGGHRASHKKSKGCFASSTIESSENTIETDGDGNTNNNHKPNSKNHHFTTNIDESLIIDGGDDQSKAEINTRVSKKTSKGHECPICLKVFPSGQALGGHKRSHLIGGGGGGGVGGASSKAKNTRPPTPTPVMPEKSIPKVRDFLDLNLPAPDEEESNGHVTNASLKPWWAGSSHKHEALVGLISN